MNENQIKAKLATLNALATLVGVDDIFQAARERESVFVLKVNAGTFMEALASYPSHDFVSTMGATFTCGAAASQAPYAVEQLARWGITLVQPETVSEDQAAPVAAEGSAT
jgi:hypothetical protein